MATISHSIKSPKDMGADRKKNSSLRATRGRTKSKRAKAISLAKKGSTISTIRSRRKREDDAGKSSSQPSPTCARFPGRATESIIPRLRPGSPQERSRPSGPGYKDARLVRRELARHTNNLVDLCAEIDSTEALLRHAVRVYNNAATEFRQLDCLRRTIEGVFLPSMKDDRTIWDGSHLLGNTDRHVWACYIEAMEKYRQKQREIERKQIEIEQEEMERNGQRCS